MMNANVNWGIAKVHLLSKKKQTIIAILGVTFGISMFILMISFMNGTNEFLQDAMLSSTPDIRIYNQPRLLTTSSVAEEYFKNDVTRIVVVHHIKLGGTQAYFKNTHEIINDIKRNKEVVAVSPVASTPVFFKSGPAQFNGIINGINISEEKKILNIQEKMIEGDAESVNGTDNGILLGQRLAENLHVHKGDVITVITAAGNVFLFRVKGIFQFGLGSVDNVTAMANINAVQHLLGNGNNAVTDIHIKLNDLNQSKQFAAFITDRYGYKADDWATANASILATVAARNVLTFVVSIALLVVAGFGIYNIMNMNIANKLKDIAILKAQGFSGKDILTIFLSQSAVIGLIGALAGIVLGFIFSFITSRVPFPKSDIVSLKYFPVIFEVKYYVFGVFFGIITTLIAGFMPALKASKSDPVSILRGQ